MISFDDALQIILENSHKHDGVETIDLESSRGRVLAEDICADRSYPPFNRSQMDGFALASEYFHKDKRYTIQQKIFAGEEPLPLTSTENNCAQIMTGAGIPVNADCVIKIEDAAAQNNSVMFNVGQVYPWQFVSRTGEDIDVGKVIVKAGSLISEANCIALASVGAAKVNVYKKINVSIISTGNEVVDIATSPNAWQIRDANLLSLKFLLEKFPVNVVMAAHSPDDAAILAALVEKALNSDLVILSGAVSQGESDQVPALLEKAGVVRLFHKCAVKPGKPIYFGKRNKTLVFGLPGNPVSCSVGFHVFVQVALHQLCGLRPHIDMRLPAAESRQKKNNLTEFVPCRITASDNGMSEVSLLGMKSSGDIMGLNDADGIAVHEGHRQVITKGELVSFYTF